MRYHYHGQICINEISRSPNAYIASLVIQIYCYLMVALQAFIAGCDPAEQFGFNSMEMFIGVIDVYNVICSKNKNLFWYN